VRYTCCILMSQITSLSDEAELDAAIEESRLRPVLLFKHSLYCGVSCEAYDELRDHVSRAVPAAAYKMITVQSHRRISDQAAARLGVRHETPQAILLKDGRPVWTASHFRVTSDALTRALAS
jgi:bacillithiol system protein YtxJ